MGDDTKFNPRREYSEGIPGYLESDRDFMDNNCDLCIQYLEMLEEKECGNG